MNPHTSGRQPGISPNFEIFWTPEPRPRVGVIALHEGLVEVCYSLPASDPHPRIALTREEGSVLCLTTVGVIDETIGRYTALSKRTIARRRSDTAARLGLGEGASKEELVTAAFRRGVFSVLRPIQSATEWARESSIDPLLELASRGLPYTAMARRLSTNDQKMSLRTVARRFHEARQEAGVTTTPALLFWAHCAGLQKPKKHPEL